MKIGLIFDNREIIQPFVQWCHEQEISLEIFSLNEYLNYNNVINGKIKWIQKSYLSENEIPENATSRFSDSFRIFYEKNSVDESLYPENLSKEMQDSLRRPLEFYIDVDVVICCSRLINEMGLGHWGAPIMGEDQWRKNLLIKTQKNSNNFLDTTLNEIAFLGQSDEVLEMLLRSKDWLFLKRNEKNEKRIFWIFSELDITANSKKYLKELLTEVDIQLRLKSQKFHLELKKWNELEDYEKVKIPKPDQPISSLVIFAGHEILSIDQLMGDSKVYLSLDLPKFRKPLIQLENSIPNLKTISVDELFYAKTRYYFSQNFCPVKKFMGDNEIGFYNVTYSGLTDAQSMKYFNLHLIGKMEDLLRTYFKRFDNN